MRAAVADTQWKRFQDAAARGAWEEAVAAGQELERATPGRPAVRYNLACVLARAGQPDEALAWLRRALEVGFRQPELIDRDADLDSLRSRPELAAARAAAAANATAYLQAARHAFDLAPPIVVLPPGHDPAHPAPLIVALHGHGGRADGYPLGWRKVAADAGAILAAPQSVHPHGGGFTWPAVEDSESIVDWTLEYVSERFAVDDARIVLTGFSQGGFITFALGARHPERYAALIPMACPYLPEVDAPSPAPPAAPRCYFMVGSNDHLFGDTRRAAKDFRAAGWPTELRVYRSTGHTLPIARDKELARALRWALGGR